MTIRNYNGGEIMRQFIKEFFTAYCQNGKIYNCQEGGLCWWHEMGHLERFKNQKLLNFYGYIILFGTPALYFTKDYPRLFETIAVFWAVMLLGFEIDAWIYAYEKWTHEF